MDVLATVLEEMPPFPEKESCGLLNLLKKKRPGRVPDNPEIKSNDDESSSGKSTEKKHSAMAEIAASGGSADLLGLGLGDSNGTAASSGAVTNGNGVSSGPTDNLKK